MAKFREQSPPPLPLTRNELQELNRTVKSETGRRLLWEIHRIRTILLRAHELEILVRDDRFLSRDLELIRMANALRADLDKEPVIEEDREEQAREKLRRHGIDI
jgi:hypothetical protein